MNETWHGTLDGYNNHHCQCEACTKENTLANARRRTDRRAALQGEPRQRGERGPEPLQAPKKHNAATYSNWGCRCEACTLAWRLAQRRWRSR